MLAMAVRIFWMLRGDTRLLSYLPRQTGSLLECKQDNHARADVVPHKHTHTHIESKTHSQREREREIQRKRHNKSWQQCRQFAGFAMHLFIKKSYPRCSPRMSQLSLCLSVCLPSLFGCHYLCLFLHVNNPSVKPLKLCQSHAVVGPFSLVSPKFRK